MKNIPNNYEEIQSKGSVYSRNHKNGDRVRRNVNEFAPLINLPVLCVGCGDGLEVECFMQHFGNGTRDILGVDISREKVAVAQTLGLPVVVGNAENIFDIVGDNKYNIYTAHTLEHTFDLSKVLSNYKKIAKDTIVIIVPIEKPDTKNKAHYTPISNLTRITQHFGINWHITTFCRFNLQVEGVIIAQRHPVKK